ncbi:hypothetical protein L6452_33882 [Arctium lappa]|uniref:Uncharacterized protein n=1 Tax=Arctium lappa TaxID=4217 RepID=A0ACB8YHB0_ARCLA|nr:hypothetical protein L6452_33882 [Arctium lappa]
MVSSASNFIKMYHEKDAFRMSKGRGSVYHKKDAAISAVGTAMSGLSSIYTVAMKAAGARRRVFQLLDRVSSMPEARKKWYKFETAFWFEGCTCRMVALAMFRMCPTKLAWYDRVLAADIFHLRSSLPIV